MLEGKDVGISDAGKGGKGYKRVGNLHVWFDVIAWEALCLIKDLKSELKGGKMKTILYETFWAGGLDFLRSFWFVLVPPPGPASTWIRSPGSRVASTQRNPTHRNKPTRKACKQVRSI